MTVERTFTCFANHGDVGLTRRNIAADVGVHRLHLVSVRETRRRLTTQFDVTVRGHPQRVREYRDARKLEHSLWREDVISAVILVGIVLPAFQTLKRKWQGRNDPPVETEENVTLTAKALAVWTPEPLAGSAGEPLGWLRIEVLEDVNPTNSTEAEPLVEVNSTETVSVSFAEAFASEHGYALVVVDRPH